MRRAALLLLLGLPSCVYYNGMYNTKRLAGEAERAERDGRTFDASGLWSQVSAKAESVLVRHPDSKYAEEAALLRGTALARLGDCAGAVVPLERVMLTGRSAEFAERAATLAGSCRVRLGDPLAALAAYARLAQSRDPSRRAFALYAQGRALSLAGAHQDGYALLAASEHPRARGERAAALAGSGRVAEAVATADSLLVQRDSLAPWDSLLTWMRRHDPESATALTGRLVADSLLPRPMRVRLILGDAEFWLPRDSARGERRFSEAEGLGQGTPLVNEIRVRAAMARIRLVADLALLQDRWQELEDLTEIAGPLAGEAARLASAAERVAIAADSTPAGLVGGDLRLFIAAEQARDSVGNSAFAAVQFRRIAAEWPESPYAAKAVLALMALQPEGRDSLREVLELDYPGNPYVVLAQGGDSPDYTVLEDSLRRFALSFRPDSRRPGPPRPRPQGQPDELAPPQPGQPQPGQPSPGQPPARPRDVVD